jgi:hypothetical protein
VNGRDDARPGEGFKHYGDKIGFIGMGVQDTNTVFLNETDYFFPEGEFKQAAVRKISNQQQPLWWNARESPLSVGTGTNEQEIALETGAISIMDVILNHARCAFDWI